MTQAADLLAESEDLAVQSAIVSAMSAADLDRGMELASSKTGTAVYAKSTLFVTEKKSGSGLLNASTLYLWNNRSEPRPLS